MEQSTPQTSAEPAAPTSEAQSRPTRRTPTRTSGMWTGAVAGTILALLLLIFILENTQSVKVSFFGADGHVALGVALLLSAVAGALIVALIGAARMAQLRVRARRAERSAAAQ